MGDIVDGMFEDGRLDWTPRRGRGLFSSRPSSAPREITCTHCGRSDLYWRPKERGGGYTLMNSTGTPHSCTKPASADDFEDVS